MIKIRSKKLPKKTKQLSSLIIIIAVLFVTLSLFFKKGEGFEFSCKTGELLKISIPRPPPACIGCVEICYGTVKAYNEGNLICTGKGASNGAFTPTSVVIPCKGIKNYLGQNIEVDYMINSSYGNFDKRWSGVIGE